MFFHSFLFFFDFLCFLILFLFSFFVILWFYFIFFLGFLRASLFFYQGFFFNTLSMFCVYIFRAQVKHFYDTHWKFFKYKSHLFENICFQYIFWIHGNIFPNTSCTFSMAINISLTCENFFWYCINLSEDFTDIFWNTWLFY